MKESISSVQALAVCATTFFIGLRIGTRNETVELFAEFMIVLFSIITFAIAN
jgi:hypothetical protein